MYTTKAQICIRRDTAANFTSANPTLALGEIAYETDTRNIKVGDGATAWTALGYINPYRGGTAAAPTSNTVLGSGAGAAMQSGASRNVAIGPSALASATTAVGNVAIGENTLRGVTTALLNTAVGDNAMRAVSGVTGQQNAAFGYNAGNGLTSGSFNTAVGADASRTNATGSNTTAVGYVAAVLNTASDITAVGANALDANTTGANNTAVGKDALGANTTGAGNVAIGNLAGSALTTGSNNVAIGLESLSSGGSTVYSSVGIGYRALWQNTGGANVAIGTNAQVASAANTGVVAIGNSAALFNTASGTTAIGSGALDANTTGTLNTAVGLNALGAYTTGEGSTAVGYQALLSTTTQNYSTAVGATAASVGQHKESTMLGWGAANSFGAGYSSITSTEKGVFVGYNARPGIGNGTGEICIGADCVGNGSSTTTIGNSGTTGTFIPAGNLTLTNGNFIVGTSGKGIDFSAHSNAAGMTSELLSDYEEGTFTPQLAFGGSTTGITYTTQLGKYTKVGRMVTVTIRLQLSSKGAQTGNSAVQNLPFTVLNEGVDTVAASGAIWGTGTSFADIPLFAPSTSTSQIVLYEVTNAGAITNLTDADFGNTSNVLITATYFT